MKKSFLVADTSFTEDTAVNCGKMQNYRLTAVWLYAPIKLQLTSKKNQLKFSISRTRDLVVDYATPNMHVDVKF